jgi:hypothetical protein
MESRYVELSQAISVDEIVRVTRDYLASWTSDDLGRLPDSCRPAWVRGPQDIEEWADRLLDNCPRAMVLEDERCLDRLTSHFLIASVRMRQLGPAL